MDNEPFMMEEKWVQTGYKNFSSSYCEETKFLLNRIIESKDKEFIFKKTAKRVSDCKQSLIVDGDESTTEEKTQYSDLYRAYTESDILNLLAINSGQYEAIFKELLVTSFKQMSVFSLFKD